MLVGFTSNELLQLRNELFRNGNFLSFIGNLDGWTGDQVRNFYRSMILF